jgi:hypothetical protein
MLTREYAEISEEYKPLVNDIYAGDGGKKHSGYSIKINSSCRGESTWI